MFGGVGATEQSRDVAPSAATRSDSPQSRASSEPDARLRPEALLWHPHPYKPSQSSEAHNWCSPVEVAQLCRRLVSVEDQLEQERIASKEAADRAQAAEDMLAEMCSSEKDVEHIQEVTSETPGTLGGLEDMDHASLADEPSTPSDAGMVLLSPSRSFGVFIFTFLLQRGPAYMRTEKRLVLKFHVFQITGSDVHHGDTGTHHYRRVIDRLRESNQRLGQDLQDAQEEIHDVGSEAKLLRQRVQVLQRSLDGRHQDYLDLEREHRSVVGDLAEAREMEKSLGLRIAELEMKLLRD